MVLAIAFQLTAQTKNNANQTGPKPGAFVPHVTEPDKYQIQNNSAQNQWNVGNAGWNTVYGYHGSVSFGFDNAYLYGYPDFYSGFAGNTFAIKKSARYSLRLTNALIEEAIGLHSWHDVYSPVLAKAIRHYQFARQLYRWGKFYEAYHHAERGRYLAWFSLQFFNNTLGSAQCYSYWPDTYDNPFNPYYKSNQSTENNEQMGTNNKKAKHLENVNMDNVLPPQEMSDRELIRSFDKNDIKEDYNK